MKGANTYFLIFIILMGIITGAYSQIEITIPDTSIESGNLIDLPVLTGDLTSSGVISYQTTIKYDQDVLSIDNVDVIGSLTESWGDPTVNTTNPGEIRVVGYGVSPLSGDGVLFTLKCVVNGQSGDSSFISFDKFLFNNNSPQVITHNGLFKIPVIPVQVFIQTNFPDITQVMVDGEYYNAPYTAIWNKGSNHEIGIAEFQEIEAGIRYAYDRWDNGSDRIQTIEVLSDTSLSATLTEQFLVDIQSDWGNPNGAGWYTNGDTVKISVDSLVTHENQSRHLFLEWSGQGEGAYSGADTQASIIVNSPITETVRWQNEYYLSTQINIEDGGTMTPAVPGGWYKEDSMAHISATANQDFIFTGWSGDLEGTENPTAILMDGAQSVTANFSRNVNITILSEPSGLKIEVDGEEFITPKEFSWLSGEVHQVRAAAQFVSEGVRYSFSEWSDAGAAEHEITVPLESTTYRAHFDKQYFLSTSVQPIGGGSVSPALPGEWYTEGNEAELSAEASWDYDFEKWSGDVSGTTNPTSIIMDSPKQVTVDFVYNPRQSEWRVNVGGNQYENAEGQIFEKDQQYSAGSRGYVNGSDWHKYDPIENTDDDILYQTERYGLSEYRFDLDNGDYLIKLHFAEIYFFSKNRRVFSVAIEGKTVLDGLDIFAEAGHDNPYVYTFSTQEHDATVNDGQLNISFTKIVDEPKISAIEIIREAEQTPLLAVLPATVNFDSLTNQSTIDILNTAGGELTWSIDKNHGLNWLSSVSLFAGTIGVHSQQSVTLSVDRTGLESGDYSGSILVNSNGGSQNVQLFMRVPNPMPELALTPTELDFGASEDTLYFQIRNNGEADLVWSANKTPDDAWIESLIPASGELTPGLQQEVQVIINREGMEGGNHTGQISVTSNDGNAYVDLSMDVYVPSPQLSLNPDALNFGTATDTLHFAVHNSGDAVLNWSSAESPETSWLTLMTPTEGIVAMGDSALLTVIVDRSGLGEGDYTSNIAVNSDGGNGTVDVSMSVHIPSAEMTVNPSQLNFGMTATTLNITVENSGELDLTWSVSESPAVDWIVLVTPENGTLPSGASQQLQVVINRDGYAAGSYQGSLVFSSNGGETTVPVSMTVGEAISYHINAGGTDYTDGSGTEWEADRSYTTGGYGYVGGKTYATSDPISGTDDDALFQSERWGMSSYRFDVPDGRYDIELLFAEVYYKYTNKRLFDVSIEGSAVLSALDLVVEAGHDVALRYEFTEIEVTDGRLDIGFTVLKDAAKISGIGVRSTPPAAPKLEVTPLTLSYGSENTTQQFTIRNSGSLDLNWSITKSPDAAWITSMTPASGTLSEGSSRVVTVDVSRDGLNGGNYTGTLNVSSNGGQRDVAVSMEVTEPTAQLSLNPQTLDFGTAESTKTVIVKNTGELELNWGLDTSSLPSWITSVTPDTGVLQSGEQAVVRVDINRTDQTEGVHQAVLIIQSNGGTKELPVQMEVTINAAVLSVDVDTLNFGAYLSEMNFSVHNSGDLELNWNVSVQPGSEWISSVAPTNGVVSIGQKSSVSVQIDRAEMEDGQYEGRLTIQSDGGNHEIVVLMSVETLPVWRINAGGSQYTDHNGDVWSADQSYGTTSGFGYVGGKTYSTSDPISGTEDDMLYQSERYNMAAYYFLVPDGTFDVTIHFAEIYHKSAGERLMDVVIEDMYSLDRIDIYDEVGHDVALQYAITGIVVNDGRLDIDFIGVKDYVKVAAIEVKMTGFPKNLLKKYNYANRLVDTTPPQSPENIHTKGDVGKVILIWNSIDEPDFDNYRIYRKGDDIQSEFELISFNYCGTMFKDSTVIAGYDYCYAITSVDVWGNESDISESNIIHIRVLEKPETFSVAQNYPNPFNAFTKINYQVKENCRVQIKIFDITGRQVRVLIDEMQSIGHHSVIWDSKDGHGNDLTSGVYLYQFKAEHYSKIKRMVMVK